MKERKRAPVFWIPILALLAGASSFSCHRSLPKAQLSLLEDQLASRLLGRQVQNEDGQELGTLNDLLLDFQGGRAEFALLASDGFLGLAKRIKIVPGQALSTRTTKQNVLELDITKPGWEQAPVLSGEVAVALNDPAFARNIERYYQIAAIENDALSPWPSRPPQQRAYTLTGHEPSKTGPTIGPARNLRSARDLKGDTIVNRRHQRIGRIADFLVDLSGARPAYAIVSTDRRERFAIPLALLNEEKTGTLVIDSSRSMFETAQRFDIKSWQGNHLEVDKILRFSEAALAHGTNASQSGGILTAL